MFKKIMDIFFERLKIIIEIEKSSWSNYSGDKNNIKELKSGLDQQVLREIEKTVNLNTINYLYEYIYKYQLNQRCAEKLCRQFGLKETIIRYLFNKRKPILDGEYVVTISHVGVEKMTPKIINNAVSQYIITSDHVQPMLYTVPSGNDSITLNSVEIITDRYLGKLICYPDFQNIPWVSKDLESHLVYNFHTDFETDNKYLIFYPRFKIKTLSYEIPILRIPLIDGILVKTSIGIITVNKRIILNSEDIIVWSEEDYDKLKASLPK